MLHVGIKMVSCFQQTTIKINKKCPRTSYKQNMYELCNSLTEKRQEQYENFIEI